jgi:hypothetical protein
VGPLKKFLKILYDSYHTLTYDTLYQLKMADYPSAWNIADANCWYDQVGNWTSVYTGTTTTYSHNRLNQYTAVGSVTPAYDSKGNITSGYGGGLTLVYDCAENLRGQTPFPATLYDYSTYNISKYAIIIIIRTILLIPIRNTASLVGLHGAGSGW